MTAPRPLCAIGGCRVAVRAPGDLCFACARVARDIERRRKQSESMKANHAARRKVNLPIVVEDMRPLYVDIGARVGYVCAASTGPCRVSECRHHLDAEPTCSIRVANRGPNELRVVGEALGVTRERSRQIEQVALRRIARARADVYRALLTFADGE